MHKIGLAKERFATSKNSTLPLPYSSVSREPARLSALRLQTMPGQSKVDSTRSIVNLVAFLLVLNMTSNWLRWSWLRQALLLSLLPLTLVLLLSRTGGTLIKPTNTSTKDQQDEANIQGSVIVPAYHEALNMRPLVEQVFAALAKHGDMAKTTEIIIVDDNSRDGTVEAIESLKQEGYNVRVIVRTNENGLSSAVLRGFTEARGQNWVVMDADLQHPPSVVPEMLKALSTKPFALGTRYATGVQVDKDWGKIRRIISWGARSLARPLTSASDPMTGFFGLRKDLVCLVLFNTSISTFGLRRANSCVLVPHGQAYQPNWIQDRTGTPAQDFGTSVSDNRRSFQFLQTCAWRIQIIVQGHGSIRVSSSESVFVAASHLVADIRGSVTCCWHRFCLVPWEIRTGCIHRKSYRDNAQDA